MNLYPGLKASMGRWTYFVVKMTMRELAESVKFAADVYDDHTLDEAIQRILEESRVKRDIVTYLIRQKDRFFSSVVIAALEGNPKWYPVSIEDDERFALFRGDARLNDTFGILSFDGTQNYYALDGQHRLSAIKALTDSNSDVFGDAPAGFQNEEISVIVVVPHIEESQDEFMKRYRRLFGNLNRYAKRMDEVTNIIMDEDDVFAIVTRRLITEHDFFKAAGRQRESPKIKTKKGKNLKHTDSYFTSLETLYEMNIRLLSSRQRHNNGWDTEGNELKRFKLFRPPEEMIDRMFDELVVYWDALIGEIPALRESPPSMRIHAIGSEGRDHVLFWPIGQELFAELARDLMDFNLPAPEAPTIEAVSDAISGLGRLQWDFHCPPWRHLLLVPDAEEMTTWKIRSEDRKPARNLAKRIVKWQIGIDELNEDDLSRLREEWQWMLVPSLDSGRVDELWQEIEAGAIR